MAKTYTPVSYFESRLDIVKIFEDLEAFHDFCGIELRKFDPADLYRKDSKSYSSYLASKRPRKPYQGNKPWPNGVRPKNTYQKKS